MLNGKTVSTAFLLSLLGFGGGGGWQISFVVVVAVVELAADENDGGWANDLVLDALWQTPGSLWITEWHPIVWAQEVSSVAAGVLVKSLVLLQFQS